MPEFEEQAITTNPTPWFSTSELLEYLAISIAELKKHEEAFVEGFHFRREDPLDPSSQTLWRIDRVDELLCLPIPPLEREAMLNATKNNITCSN